MTPSRRFGLLFRGFAQHGSKHGPTQIEASVSSGKEVAMRYYQTLFACLLSIALTGCGESRLIDSIRDGNLALSEQLLAAGGNLNARGTGGETALHVAITAINKDIYSKLLLKGADPNICDSQGTSVIHLAAERKDVFWLREAFKHGGNPNQLNTGNPHYPKSTPIFYAISKRLTLNVVELIAAGADVNHEDEHGTRPLSDAMEMDLYDAVIKLIEAGADLSLVEIHKSGRFDEGYEITLDNEMKKQSLLELKALLIAKGYLKKK